MWQTKFRVKYRSNDDFQCRVILWCLVMIRFLEGQRVNSRYLAKIGKSRVLAYDSCNFPWNNSTRPPTAAAVIYGQARKRRVPPTRVTYDRGRILNHFNISERNTRRTTSRVTARVDLLLPSAPVHHVLHVFFAAVLHVCVCVCVCVCVSRAIPTHAKESQTQTSDISDDLCKILSPRPLASGPATMPSNAWNSRKDRQRQKITEQTRDTFKSVTYNFYKVTVYVFIYMYTLTFGCGATIDHGSF